MLEGWTHRILELQLVIVQYDKIVLGTNYNRLLTLIRETAERNHSRLKCSWSITSSELAGEGSIAIQIQSETVLTDGLKVVLDKVYEIANVLRQLQSVLKLVQSALLKLLVD